MKENRIQTRIVDWRAIPKGDWEGLLESVCPIGGYIESLPYQIPATSRKFSVPLLRGLNARSFTQGKADTLTVMPCMRFTRAYVYRLCDNGGWNKVAVWLREE